MKVQEVEIGCRYYLFIKGKFDEEFKPAHCDQQSHRKGTYPPDTDYWLTFFCKDEDMKERLEQKLNSIINPENPEYALEAYYMDIEEFPEK